MKSVVRAAVAALLGMTTVAPEWALGADGGAASAAPGDLRLADADGGPNNLDTLIVLGTEEQGHDRADQYGTHQCHHAGAAPADRRRDDQ